MMSKLKEIEDIVIKLIDRWNRSDEMRDRRHDTTVQELNKITEDLKYNVSISNNEKIKDIFNKYVLG